MKFKVEIELEKVSGVEQDKDTLIDAFAGHIGKDNAARPPLRFTVLEDGEVASVYIVKCVDDA